MIYLAKSIGGTLQGQKCAASGQDIEASGHCLQKQAGIMNNDKRPRPQL